MWPPKFFPSNVSNPPKPLPDPSGVLLVFTVETNQKAKDEGGMSLERGIIRYGGCGNNEQVEETECGETDNDASDNPVDEEEEGGEGTTKEEESGLKHERQTFHDGVEVLGDCSIHLALPMPTTIGNGSSHLDMRVSIEWLDNMATNTAKREAAKLE